MSGKQRAAIRRQKNQALGKLDAANRCPMCKLPLPRLGALIAALSGHERFCSDACFDEAQEKTR